MADYVVTGEITPDATGEYVEDGTYGGGPCYRRADSAYWIWKWLGALWVLSSGKGVFGTWWQRAFASGLIGDYEPWGGAIGTATVAEPPPELTLGPYRTEAGDVWHTGIVAGDTFTTGSRAGDVCHTGIVAGKVR